jgi:hypothetical protein
LFWPVATSSARPGTCTSPHSVALAPRFLCPARWSPRLPDEAALPVRADAPRPAAGGLPPPKGNLVRYFGVFAPNARWRHHVVPGTPPPPLTPCRRKELPGGWWSSSPRFTIRSGRSRSCWKTPRQPVWSSTDLRHRSEGSMQAFLRTARHKDGTLGQETLLASRSSFVDSCPSWKRRLGLTRCVVPLCRACAGPAGPPLSQVARPTALAERRRMRTIRLRLVGQIAD